MLKSQLSNLLDQIGKTADCENLECFLVGGFVRDLLLSRESKDIDIMVVGDPIIFSKKLYKSLNAKNIIVFERFRTSRLVIKLSEDEDIMIEVVGARKESYNSHSRKPITQIGTLKDDLSRRDFTINAIAFRLNKSEFGELVDFFDGRNDLENHIIRTPLDPKQTFEDDPLRMMRAARFACQLNFKVDPNILLAIQENVERISIVSKERISDEFLKIVSSPKPSIGLSILFQTGLLKIIFPELEKLHGVEQIDGKGHKDVFWHTLEVVDNISKVTDKLWLRVAAILHDIGKPATKRFKKNKGWTFHGHDAVGAKIAASVFRRLRLPLASLKYVQKLIRLHLRPIPLSQNQITDSAIRRLIVDAGEDVQDLMTLCRADVTSKNPLKVKKVINNFEIVEKKIHEVSQKDIWAKWRPPVDGSEIMKRFGLKEGKLIGKLKSQMENAILDGQIPYNKHAALEFMAKKVKELKDS